MTSQQRTDRQHAVALIDPLAGPINQQGVRTFTRDGAGRYRVQCEEAIASAEGFASVSLPTGVLGLVGASLSNADTGEVSIEISNELGVGFDPPTFGLHVWANSIGPSGPIPTATPIGVASAFYVDTITGNDNNPGTLALPFATIDRALSLVPATLARNIEIVLLDVGPHAVGAAALQPRASALLANGDPAALYIRGNLYTEEVAPFVCGAGTTDALVEGAGLVLDAHMGQFIEILTGAATGQIRQCRNNTVAGLVPMRAFAGVLPGDSARVITPACIVDLSAVAVMQGATVGDLTETQRYAGGLVWESVRFVGALPVAVAGRVTFYACDDDGTAIFLPQDSAVLLQAGIDDALLTLAVAPQSVRGLAADAFLGAGFAVRNAAGAACWWNGYLFAASMGAFSPVKAQIRGGRFTGGPSSYVLVAFDGAVLLVGSGDLADLPPLITAAVTDGVMAILGGFVRVRSLECIGTDNVIGAIGGASAFLQPPDPRLIGVGTVYGVYARLGGKVYLSNDTPFTGATANIAAGTVAAVAAGLAAAGDSVLPVLLDGSAVTRVG